MSRLFTWFAIVVSVALAGTISAARSADASPNAKGHGALRSPHPTVGVIKCQGNRGLPRGTNLTAIAVEQNTPSRVVVSARFDGPIPLPVENPQAGDLEVVMNFYLFVPGDSQDPYDLLMSETTIQAGRLHHGFVDSSDVHLDIAGSVYRVTFDPSVFTKLPAGHPFPISADTSVDRFDAGPSRVGFFEVGTQRCPRSGSPPTTTTSTTAAAPSGATGVQPPASGMNCSTDGTLCGPPLGDLSTTPQTACSSSGLCASRSSLGNWPSICDGTAAGHATAEARRQWGCPDS